MFKVFDKLKKADRFWNWLDGIAFNKVRSHYGRRWRHKTVSLSDAGCEIAETNSPDWKKVVRVFLLFSNQPVASIRLNSALMSVPS